MGIVLAATVAAVLATPVGSSNPGGPFREDPAAVFQAKAALQQYLSRVVRKDWDGARALLARRGAGKTALRQTEPGVQLKTFRFVEACEVEPGVVAVEVGEDNYRPDRQGMFTDEPAVYLIVRARSGYRIADRRSGQSLARTRISPAWVRATFPGYEDARTAKARRTSAFSGGVHR